MNRKALAEFLTQYVDDLNRAAGKAAVSITTFAEERRELQPLIPIIERLTETLVPVEPSREFHDALKAKLIVAWYEQRREQKAKDRQQRWKFFLRAAAVGSCVSVAALITVVARSRMHHIRAH